MLIHPIREAINPGAAGRTKLFSASLWVCLAHCFYRHLELLLLMALLLGMGLDMELDLQQAIKLLALLLDLDEPVPGPIEW